MMQGSKKICATGVICGFICEKRSVFFERVRYLARHEIIGGFFEGALASLCAEINRLAFIFRKRMFAGVGEISTACRGKFF
jgi:hypothetical protein